MTISSLLSDHSTNTVVISIRVSQRGARLSTGLRNPSSTPHTLLTSLPAPLLPPFSPSASSNLPVK